MGGFLAMVLDFTSFVDLVRVPFSAVMRNFSFLEVTLGLPPARTAAPLAKRL